MREEEGLVTEEEVDSFFDEIRNRSVEEETQIILENQRAFMNQPWVKKIEQQIRELYNLKDKEE